MQMGGTKDPVRTHAIDSDANWLMDNDLKLSFLVAILPFIEQQALWEQIVNPRDEDEDGTVDYPAMGPQMAELNYTPWRTQVTTYRCPSDPTDLLGGAFGATNYAACVGDSPAECHFGGIHVNGNVDTDPSWGEEGCRRWNRGVFRARHFTKFGDIKDGLSNTIAGGEIVIHAGEREIIANFLRLNSGPAADQRAPGSIASDSNLIDPLNPTRYADGATIEGVANNSRGRRWHQGSPGFTSFQTIRPPNSYSASRGWAEDQGFYTAASRHQGGCHVLMADGAVKFVTDSIESGDQTAVSPGNIATSNQANWGLKPGDKSNYGLWGSLGTSRASETIEEEL